MNKNSVKPSKTQSNTVEPEEIQRHLSKPCGTQHWATLRYICLLDLNGRNNKMPTVSCWCRPSNFDAIDSSRFRLLGFSFPPYLFACFFYCCSMFFFETDRWGRAERTDRGTSDDDRRWRRQRRGAWEPDPTRAADPSTSVCAFSRLFFHENPVQPVPIPFAHAEVER